MVEKLKKFLQALKETFMFCLIHPEFVALIFLLTPFAVGRKIRKSIA